MVEKIHPNICLVYQKSDHNAYKFIGHYDKFFDGKKTNQINGRYDTGSFFVNGIREYEHKNKKYFPSINLTNRAIGNHIIGRQKVKRLEIQTSLQKTRYETSKYEISPDDFPFILKSLKGGE